MFLLLSYINISANISEFNFKMSQSAWFQKFLFLAYVFIHDGADMGPHDFVRILIESNRISMQLIC